MQSGSNGSTLPQVWVNTSTGDILSYAPPNYPSSTSFSSDWVLLGYAACCVQQCGFPTGGTPGFPVTHCPPPQCGNEPGGLGPSTPVCPGYWACWRGISGCYCRPSGLAPDAPGDLLIGLFPDEKSCERAAAAFCNPQGVDCMGVTPCAAPGLELTEMLMWKVGVDSGDWKKGSESYLGKLYSGVSAYGDLEGMVDAIDTNLDSLAGESLPSFITFVDTLA